MMRAVWFFVGTVTGLVGSVVAAQLWMHLAEHSAYTGRRKVGEVS